VVLEALCIGVPIMHKRKDEEFAEEAATLYPMIHADSARQVTNGLVQLIEKKGEMQKIGEVGREWFLNYCVEQPISEIVSIIKKKKMETKEQVL
jgi:phosphosulfolactate phosphohydrolase-like enzyme